MNLNLNSQARAKTTKAQHSEYAPRYALKLSEDPSLPPASAHFSETFITCFSPRHFGKLSKDNPERAETTAALSLSFSTLQSFRNPREATDDRTSRWSQRALLQPSRRTPNRRLQVPGIGEAILIIMREARAFGESLSAIG